MTNRNVTVAERNYVVDVTYPGYLAHRHAFDAWCLMNGLAYCIDFRRKTRPTVNFPTAVAARKAESFLHSLQRTS